MIFPGYVLPQPFPGNIRIIKQIEKMAGRIIDDGKCPLPPSLFSCKIHEAPVAVFIAVCQYPDHVLIHGYHGQAVLILDPERFIGSKIELNGDLPIVV